ncbi:MAG: outer membrane beta-barrel protein, partial [Flavobacteriales bacterium]
ATKGADINRDPIFFMNTALTKELLQKKGTLTFNITDLFNTRIRGREVMTDTYFSDSDFQWRERQWTLNFTYRFGKRKKEKTKEIKNNVDHEDFSM